MTKEKKPSTRIVYRDSDKGHFVTREYAVKHPKTTERQHVRLDSSRSNVRRK